MGTAGNPTNVPTANGKPINLPWPKGFDAQQQQQLIQLSQQGLLSGIPPQIIAYIQQAESSFGYNAGGVINPQGYGGYFGLAKSKKYPAGSTSPDLLHCISPTCYAQQAIIAASAFASYLPSAQGDFIGAENIYQTGKQTGSGNGAGIFEQYGIKPGELGLLNASPFPIPGDAGVASTSETGLGASPIGNPISDVNSFFKALGNGFGLGWSGIFTIVLGGLMILIGLIFIFRKQAVKIGEAAVTAA